MQKWIMVVGLFSLGCNGAPDDSDAAETDVTVDTEDTEDTADTDNPLTEIPDLEYDEDDCLTYSGASEFCGSASDGSICELAATCREDSSTSQCSIDCEMSTSGTCLTVDDVECVWNAFQAEECPALGECPGWYLVY